MSSHWQEVWQPLVRREVPRVPLMVVDALPPRFHAPDPPTCAEGCTGEPVTDNRIQPQSLKLILSNKSIHSEKMVSGSNVALFRVGPASKDPPFKRSNCLDSSANLTVSGYWLLAVFLPLWKGNVGGKFTSALIDEASLPFRTLVPG